ncbi:MAG: acetyl-CoA carboxylase biotin carboxylase subunit family protein [Planctomycetia bacterium]
MHVLFVEPRFPANQRRFVRGLREAGARVTGIGEAPREALGAELAGWLHGYEQVRSVVDEQALYEAVRRVQQCEWVDRLEATVEAHVQAAARVRSACGIPGTSEQTAWLCRDKPSMKEALRRAGVPTARSLGSDDAGELRRFARECGYPLVVKPRSAAGASGTVRVDGPEALEEALAAQRVGQGGSVAIEEFIEGHEGFYDTLSVGGHVVLDFISHYYPGVLEAMRTRWISPQIVTTNRTDAPGYAELKAMGARVVDALGIGTSATHMEWFFGPRGLTFSEIGCRPPGVGAWDLYCAANDFDLYRAWGQAIVTGHVRERPSRRLCAGMINLRPDRDGRIVGYSGVDRVFARYGALVIDAHLPPLGTPCQPVEAGYMANAWLRLKHPDYDTLREVLDDIGRTLKVHAG